MQPASAHIPAKYWSRTTGSARSTGQCRIFSTPANAIGSASEAMNVVDGGGATLMPGMIDAHLHLSWNNAPGIDPIQMMETEEHMLVTMEMAKLVLDAGFTAGRVLRRQSRGSMSSPSASSMKGGFLVRVTSLPVPRSPPSAALAILRHRIFRMRDSISAGSFRGRKKCAGLFAN
ncbi:MAG: hypothetical protein R3D29_03505 [Nitratireductor sp.]